MVLAGGGYDFKNKLPDEVEHIMPDYSLYTNTNLNTAYGFLTSGGEIATNKEKANDR